MFSLGFFMNSTLARQGRPSNWNVATSTMRVPTDLKVEIREFIDARVIEFRIERELDRDPRFEAEKLAKVLPDIDLEKIKKTVLKWRRKRQRQTGF